MKINRMTNEQIAAKIVSLNSGQSHTYKNDAGKEVTKQGSSHSSSAYYRHLKEELNRRL